jgi:hypothetical protein
MTDIALLEQLKKYVEELTKDIILPVRILKDKTTEDYDREQGEPVTHRAAEIFKMRLPNPEAETARIPYILLQLLTGKDDQSSDGSYDSDCRVRLIAATYDEDGQEGAMALLNLLTRIRIDLLRERQVGDFLVRLPLERVIYPDSVSPYHFGELMIIFEPPEIEREVNFYG